MNRIAVYLLERPIGGGLPAEQRYGFHAYHGWRKVGEIATDREACMSGDGRELWVGKDEISIGNALIAAIAGEHGLAWHPTETPT